MDYNAASDTLKRLARDREAMQFAADAFTALGSIDQATKESERARDVAVIAANVARSELEKAKSGVDRALVKASGIIQKATDEAATMIESARRQSETVTTTTKARLEAMEAEAKAKASAALADHDHKLQVIMSTMRDLAAQEKQLRDSITAKAVQLGELEAKFKAAREAAAAMLA